MSASVGPGDVARAASPVAAAPAPLVVERIALACVIAVAALGQLVKVSPTDTGWQLATAQWARATGSWPATNTFSHTTPDYPLYQQYPALQAAMLVAFDIGGWAAISILQSLLWTVALVAWMRWSGPWRVACLVTPAWLLVVYAMETRRSGLRPEQLTILFLVLQLAAQDRYRAACSPAARWAWAALAPPLVLVWANCHQMFALGLALQGLFIVHVLAARHLPVALLARTDAAVPLAPLVVALALSCAACFATPLGVRVIDVPLNMLASTQQFRRLPGHPHEMESVLDSTFATGLVAAWVALALIALRRAPWSVRECGLLALGAVLVAPAVRGLSFCGFLATAVFARIDGGTIVAGWGRHARTIRAVLAAIIIGNCVSLAIQWATPEGRRTLLSPHPGVGRHDPAWPDRTIAFLHADRPPGAMLNLSWPSGNWLIPGLMPDNPRVFIDARVESYPRDFLAAYLAATARPEPFHDLLAAHRPGWIVADTDFLPTRQRIGELVRGGGWAFVFVEPIAAVLVERRPESRDYLARHEIALESLEIDGFVEGYPDLAALQQIQAAQLLRECGREASARRLLDLAKSVAALYPNVATALGRKDAAAR